jgi:hypothetical protein
MKVTILTIYSSASVIDDLEELILDLSEEEPEIYTDLNVENDEGSFTAEWFHPDLGKGNLDYREKLYWKIRKILPESHLAIIEDEESQEIMTIGDLSYFKNVIKRARNLEELEEIQERIEQTEIGNPLLKIILNKSYQARFNSLQASA